VFALLLQIVLVLLPAIMLLIELSSPKEKRFRRTRLTVAVLLLVGSVIWTCVDYFSGEKSDRERTADLRTLQKMSSSLIDLCFELELAEVEASYGIDVGLQIATKVNTTQSTTGIFADYFHINHSHDSGWYNGFSSFSGYKSLVFVIDTARQSLRFVLSNFGVSTAGTNDRIGWKPLNIADLGSVEFEVSAAALGIADHKHQYFDEWCPIRRVRIYANTFDADNLLVVADRAPKSPEAVHAPWQLFLPKWHRGFSDPDTRTFRIEPTGIRLALLGE